MAVAVSYPGVYIQEVPSGVRTVAGVPTSIAAFVGYTSRGPTQTPVQIFSFADFERRFGGLHQDSPLSYSVSHFFLNGGATAWIARVATGDSAAAVGLLTAPGGTPTLRAEAASSGGWGNSLRLAVDYATANPASTFNLTVTELVDRGGTLVAGRVETHRNLSMNSRSANYAVDAVRAGSQLVRLTALGAAIAGAGTSESGVLTLAGNLDRLDDDHRRLAISLDGGPFYEFALFGPGGAPTDAAIADRLDSVASAIEAAVQALEPGNPAFSGFACARGSNDDTLVATSGTAGDEESSVRFARASSLDAAAILRLGTSFGGRETDAAASIRPAQTGTAGGRIPDFSAVAIPDGTTMTVTLADASNPSMATVTVTLHDTAAVPPVAAPTSLEAARTRIETACRASARAEFARARIAVVDDALVLTPGGDGLSNRFVCSGDGAELLFLTDPAANPGDPAAVINVSAYRMGAGVSALAMTADNPGNDGTPPTALAIQGSPAAKTGIFALEDADLFNILNLPGVSDVGVLSEAIAYAEARRSMILIDVPASVTTFDQARAWINDPANSGLRHRNAVTYWPRIRTADPLKNNRLGTFANAGLMAGLYARTDAARGVWKAPAGTEARLTGVQGLEYVASDSENGVLNPLGLNVLRTFPVIGTVSWGARTMVGADALADEWKYVPVRRLALFIEESLYRGTQWVVFEPNDEPLWAQIRLSVGTFMNNLFRQGAFQGKTPNEAYLVKCDATTTTQADIDLGIVNIFVGFAPLKPAEFVIIQIQQLAGQSQA
jgi:uncharacterized protein